MGCQSACSELIERKLGARSPTERLQDQRAGERMGSRPSAAGGGGAPAPALRPADHRSTSKTQLLPGDRALLPPSPCGLKVLSSPVEPNEPPQDFDASVGASRPHDFAVRDNISRSRAVDRSRIQRTHPAITSRAKRCRVHRIPPRVRDDHDTPLWWGGMTPACRDDLPDGVSEIFLQRGLDTQITKQPVGQISRLPGQL